MPKCAYFERGHSQDGLLESLDGWAINKIPIWDVLKTNILAYDMVLIPSHYNQDVLMKLTHRLKAFVKYGGLLVALGAVACKHEWIPYCKYQQRDIELNSMRVVDTDSPEAKKIFNELKVPDNLRFQTGFTTHGHLTCAAETCRQLIVDNDNHEAVVMAIIEPKGSDGKMFVTTLDPDCHAIVGYALEEIKDYNPHAIKLFQNILNWAKYERQSRIVKWWRNCQGLVKTIWSSLLVLCLIIVCLIALVAFMYSKIDKNLFVTFAAISSISSFILTLNSMRRK